MQLPTEHRHQRYAQFHREFRWHIPQRFNFATDVVDRWAANGDPLALVWENAAGQRLELRYSQVATRAARFGELLIERGVERGDRVIVMLPRIPQWQIAIVACLRIGAVAVPCIEMLTARDIEYRVRNSAARAVVCRAEMTHKLDSVRGDVAACITVDEPVDGWIHAPEAMASCQGDSAAAQIAAEDPAIMYYTSGSTGHPKGVLHASRAIYAWRYSAVYWLDLSPADRIWCTADTGWSKAGTSVLFGPWSCGACALFYDGPFDPRRRLELLSHHRVSVFCAPATELYRLVNEDMSDLDLGALRRTVSAGEAMNPVVAKRWQEATGSDVAEAYGQTEALMLTLNYPHEPVKPGSMGRAAPGLQVDIIDDHGRRVDDLCDGHVALKMPSPQMMIGYWRDPERTERCFIDGVDGRWYLTGDRGHRDEDGYLWFSGRDDDLISSAGYRIGPLEVENVLLEHPAVQECAVVGTPDRERGELVKAFIVPREGVTADEALAREIQHHCKTQTAPYKYPRAIEFIDELPKTITGKIRRSELKRQERVRAEQGTEG